MSRGHSQPRHQFGRRVLERCKAKDNIEVIDVDKGEIDVVIIDEPETSHQGPKGKASGNCCYPDGVISIDDEEGVSDDAPKNLHGYAKNKVLRPGSSDSSTSEESQSDECPMTSTKCSNHFKMRMNYTACSSRNRFGLGSDSGTNTSKSDCSYSSECESWQSSESDTSDCEIIEDSSGNIREEWERAALRKKKSEKGHFGLEDQASPSASSGDPGLSSEEGPQSKINVETCSSKGPNVSSSTKRRNAKESSFDMPVAPEFNNSHLKTKANASIAEQSRFTDGHDDEAGSQKNEHNSERTTGKDKFMDGTFVHNKLAGVEHLEKLLRHPLCPPDVHLKFTFRDDGVFFLGKDMQVPVRVSLSSEGLNLKFKINNGFSEYMGRISSSTKDFTSATAELIDLFSKIEANSSTDADSTTDIHHEESAFHMEKVTAETCRDKAQSLDEAFPDGKASGIHHVEELLRRPSRPLEVNCNMNAEDAEACTSADSHLKSKVNTCAAETDTPANISHVEPGFQTKENISEACGYNAQSTNESLQHDKRADSKVECNMDINVGASFLDRDMHVPTGMSLGTDGLHGGCGFQEEVAPCCGKTFSCSHQTSEGKGAPDSVGLQEQKKENIGEPSSIGQSHCSFVVSPHIASSQNKEKPVIGETSICNHQPLEKSVPPVDTEVTRGRSSCNSIAGRMLVEQSHIPLIHGDLISERERHKESDEYRQADEKEWAARQQQLRIQAEEVQRLKRKRKAESLRLLDMERRQKERLEEIRESEKKGKETENLKERFRAEVTKELVILEHKYKDMASLLRGLGISVAGGPYPMTHEVNVAYKRALLKFHPDRASKTSIRQQVEAEEKFKLISRLKEKLQF